MTLFRENQQMMIELQNGMEAGDYRDVEVHRNHR